MPSRKAIIAGKLMEFMCEGGGDGETLERWAGELETLLEPAGAQEAKPSPENILEWLEDTLEQVISDSIDMDWQPRWAAKRICERLEAAGFDFHSLARIDEALST